MRFIIKENTQTHANGGTNMQNNKKITIAPSIMCADLCNLEKV